MLLDRSLNRTLIRANHLPDLLTVLEDQESGHSAHAELLGDVGDFVDVKFVELGVGEFAGHGDDFRGDDFAGAAPIRGGKERVSISERTLNLEVDFREEVEFGEGERYGG